LQPRSNATDGVNNGALAPTGHPRLARARG